MRVNARVSVVVLTYRDFSLLPRCLSSIFFQDYDNIEVIIQDDGSSEFDRKYIETLLKEKKRNIKNIIINHNEKNLGTVKNYNIAVKFATGEYILPLACDDMFYDSKVIKNTVNFFQKTNCNVCIGYIIGELSHKVYPTKKEIELLLPENRMKLRNRLFASNFICGAAIYWKTKFLQDIGGFDEAFKLVEDYPMVLRLLQYNEQVFFMPIKTVIHGENGVSTRRNTLKKKNIIAHNDAQHIKDKYVMPYLDTIEDKNARRYILACYYLKFSENKKQFIIEFLKYTDVWISVFFYLIWKKIKNRPEISFYEYRFERQVGLKNGKADTNKKL